MKITSTPTTLFLDHHQEINIPSSDDVVDTTLSLAAADDDQFGQVHADPHKAVTIINLAKFRNDIDFLGLSTTADCSRNYKNDGPVDDHNRRVNPKSDVNLAKFVDTSSDYEINRGRRVTALNPMPLRSYHPAYGYMDYYSTHHQDQASSSTTSCAGKKRKREPKNNNNNDIDFLGSGITPDYCSRNYNEVDPKSDEQAINLAKLRTWSDFLGLGIVATLSNCKINHGRPINPKPLRSYHPTRAFSTGKKRMREQKVNERKERKRSRVDEYPDPIIPPSELVQRIGQAIRPVFLYRKQLEEWDTRDDQNRLFVNDRTKLMVFLTEEERRAVEDPKRPGIDLVGIDRMGREYDLHSNVWKSLDMAVFNKGWHKIVEDNRAKKGDWVHLWAYRRGQADQFCLYVDFRDQP